MWIRNLMVALLLLHAVSSVQGTSCSTNAPPSFCNFYGGDGCGWTGGRILPTTESNVSLLRNEEIMRSEVSCPTSSVSSHCLTFDYTLFGDPNARLLVSYTWWTGTSGNTTKDQWNSVPFEFASLSSPITCQYPVNNVNLTRYNFTVNFQVSAGPTHKVHLDNIRYEKSPCTATSTPSTTSTSNSVTATTATTTTTTTTASPAVGTTTVSSTQRSHSEAGLSTSTSNSSSTETVNTTEISHSAPPSSNNVGLIVGVVVAVIVLLVIGIVVFVVVARRRGMDFWKTCFSKQKANDTDDITMDSVPSTAVLNMNGQSSNADRSYENTLLQRDDYYNVIGNADAASHPRDSSSEYAKVNKPPKKTTTANRTSYENTEDPPPSNLAPGFEYNHLDFGKRPGTKAGAKSTAAAANYSHIHTPREEHTDGAYSLARNPEGQNSESVNDATYQEPLKPAGVYHVLDRDQEEGRNSLNTNSVNTDSANTYSVNTDSANTAGIYHVPDDGGVETGNYANENSSSNVYHDPYDSSIPRQYQNDANRYGNVEGESADVPNIPSSSSSNVYHSIEERPENRPAKPQPPRKPVGVYELAQNPAAAAKKPTSPSKPNTTPHRPPPNTGTSVYHVLESPKSGMGDNYALAGPISDSLPSTSVYQLAEQTESTSHIQPSFSNDGDYNALDFNARNVPQKAEYVDTDPRAVYNHLNEGDGTYNETNKKLEVINDEYSHLS